jgi:hypothetical protein
MKLRGILIVIPVLVLISAIAAGAQTFWSADRTKTSLSVFAAIDSRSNESGYGASVTIHGPKTIDISYADFGPFQLAQIGQLAPKPMGMLSTNLGFVIGYAERDEGTTMPEGMLSGLELMLARQEISAGMALDVKVTSLSKDFDPIAWLSSPDVLWLAAGVSYAF